jgi:DNA polymerase III subunit chi
VTSIDFYFNADDRLQVACRLAGKALSQKKRMLVYAPDSELASRIDRMLWTWPALGFVPHCPVHDALAPATPVLIGGEEAWETQLAGCDVILNLCAGCPPHFERFDRLLEVVGAGDEERNAGRERYRFYLDRGYKITNHDLAKSAGGAGEQHE